VSLTLSKTAFPCYGAASFLISLEKSLTGFFQSSVHSGLHDCHFFFGIGFA
jgi:hypothetical protein